jgi:heat shock protein HslJ
MRGFLAAAAVAVGLGWTPSVAGQLPSPESAAELRGTAWQLVRFQGPDATSRTLDDRTRYQIELQKNGSLVAQIDCNRGRGGWSSEGPGQIKLGALAITRVQCGPGSMHDQILNHWSHIRTYALRNGHLFLSLEKDGGSYEFEPAPAPAR